MYTGLVLDRLGHAVCKLERMLEHFEDVSSSDIIMNYFKVIKLFPPLSLSFSIFLVRPDALLTLKPFKVL